ncbi:MAG TPA: signal peptide peptidase SppA [Nocardioidaceae bacterium]|nr:signal peptide peptidase SppA [Nocardioidaceae bacterium]
MKLPSRLSSLPHRSAPTLLELDLTRGLLESPASTPLEAIQARRVTVLRSVVDTLRKAATDDSVGGLVAHIGRTQPTLAQSSELRAAIQDFRRHGKSAVCWSESYGEMGPGNVAYHLATAFEEIWLQPTGDVGLTGVVAQAVFVRDALDKLGIDPQIGQRHEYKSAANTFLESTMTEPHREMAERLVESAMQTICADIAAARGISVDAVRAAVDRAPLSAQEALDRGLVDRLGYRDEVYGDLRGRLGARSGARLGARSRDVRLRYVERYGKGLAASTYRMGASGRKKSVVAVVQATGGIHLGRSSGRSPASGPTVGSDTVGAVLRAAGDDDHVKAVVLRIDSPGGSYLASDAIRREILRLRRCGTPVVASMASVAASGGYYIAMPADVVVASPGTLTGSIGVLAGKQVLRDALARIGVQRESVASGAYAEMFSTQRPFSDIEWERLEEWLDRIYADFTTKAANDRSMDVEALREVAKGRVWTGADAVELGLVDQLGTLPDAVDLACARAGVTRADVAVHTVPKPGMLDRLRPAENSDAPAAASVAQIGVGAPALEHLLNALGLPGGGVLTMPVHWQLG